MKFRIIYLVLVWWPTWLCAQQRPQYSQYVINNYLINPAISGIEEYADVKLGYRNQWTGVQGAPVTLYLTGHTKFGRNAPANAINTPLNKPASFGTEKSDYGTFRKVKPHHGVGGTILHDKIGPFSRTEVSATYAYHLPLNQTIKLATGAAAGVINQGLRSDYLTFTDATDEMDAGWNKFSPNVSVGIWLYSSDFYLGASALQLFSNANSPNIKDNPNNFTNHYLLTAAYKIKVSRQVAIVPSVLAKFTQPSPLSLDYNVRSVLADRFWAGVSLRQADSFAFLAGMTLNHYLEISYAYDLGTSTLGRESGGSHEIVLGFRLNNKNKIICPQNLW